MTAPNHIAGGIVFTGVFCSLWNINIFSNQYYIIATVVGSLLPDIDHTKSLIGKCFYPLSKWINKKYGHRTITHSILFLLVVLFISYTLGKLDIIPNQITTILFFSVFSHLLFDMLTVQGVPLLYPFKRNPCVIPGNPDLRIKSGDYKTEGIFFFCFALFTFSFQNLFAQGFWTTYNQQFNSIQHTHREFDRNKNLLLVDYNYNKFQKQYKGKGYLVYADFQQLYILNDSLHHLQEGAQGQRIDLLKAIPTKDTLILKTVHFKDVSLDSLNSFLAHKYISYSKLFASNKVDVVTLNGLIHHQYFEIKNDYNLYFFASLKDTLSINESKKEKAFRLYNEKKESLLSSIREKEIVLDQEYSIINNSKKELRILRNKLQNAKNIISYSNDSFEVNEAKENVIEIEKKINNYTFKDSKLIARLQHQINEMKLKYAEPFVYDESLDDTFNISFNGVVEYFLLPKININDVKVL